MGKEEFQFTDKQQVAYDACTVLQRRVAINIVRGNMSQRASYYESGGKAKNHKSADVNVSRILSYAKVKAFMNSLSEEVAGNAIMERQEALEILSHIGRTKLTDIVDFQHVQVPIIDDEGVQVTVEQAILTVKNANQIKPEHAYSLSEVASSKDGLKVKIHSGPAAIKQLGIMEGWESATKHEHSGPGGKPIETKSLSDEEIARKLAFLLTKGDLKKK